MSVVNSAMMQSQPKPNTYLSRRVTLQNQAWILSMCGRCCSSENLQKCSRCPMVYCGRECQLNHWKKHKPICDEISSMINQDTSNIDGRAPIKHVSRTHVGFVCPGKLIPFGLPKNFGLLQAAEKHAYFSKEGKGRADFFNHRQGWLSQTLGEVDYKAFYDDLTIHNQQEWDYCFQHPTNISHLLSTHGTLMKLAAIYSRRETYKSCGEVSDYALKIMQLCRQHCSPNDSSLTQHCDYDEYRMNLIRSGMNMKSKFYEANIPYYRKLCMYQLQYLMPPSLPLDLEKQSHLCSIQMVRELSLNEIPTEDEICAISDKVMVDCMKEYELQNFVDETGKNSVQLMSCENCNKIESALGEFKQCPACGEVVYCGKKCQKEHWKSQKKECGKKEERQS